MGFVVVFIVFFFLMIRRPPRSTLDRSSAASDVYKRQVLAGMDQAPRLNKNGVLNYMMYQSACAPETPVEGCLLYTSPSPRDRTRSRMPSSA